MPRARKLYKLTDQDSRTYGGCQWGEGVEHTASGKGELCSEGWLHAYEDPLLAVLFNPIHANFQKPRLWEARGVVGKSDGLKVGCTRLKTMHKVEWPRVSTKERVRFAILVAQEVCKNPKWNEWARDWLAEKNRAAYAAHAAAYAAKPCPNFASLARKAIRDERKQAKFQG